ncbi:3-hydroxyacyl-CoA dehydrogenase family protein [Peterkaempfera bronchialis]|uniref:3-hydroxyacyl-CoA dehydrogenase family protein n=1 Tax=Peterkaempfera bronchialis TaxID=2126346 RepID=A0A345SU80_9ACTN|nr:3-hydroxyacyl-CoA dehydrogenase family protein [Peterkaempfera bronchialis]AXI77285.1 3-hydroxyacyl-CoA dehydrogenase family protein [Peterkaempfera bronchialis]
MNAPGPVAIVGAGTMGAGLAQVAAAAGRDVVLYSRTGAGLDRATAAIEESLRRIARRDADDGAPADPAEVLGRISRTTDLGDCARADVVIESIAEDLRVKQGVFAALDHLCTGARILATNTSGIPIGLIARATARPERVVGTHFFSPVPMMRLCEIVRGPETSDTAMAVARAFADEIGKESVVVDRDTPGFITTRLLTVLILEAIRMVEDGTCRAADLDRACQLGFGHPMGPLASVDLSGLDVFQDVAAGLHRATGNPAYQAPALLGDLVAAGHHGRKTGRGFHDYADTAGQARAGVR